MSERFVGEIAGTGTRSGVRLVIGRWVSSPLGPFVDVMVEQDDGHRVLVAPTDAVADYVSSLYTFDEVVVATVDCRRDGARLTLRSPPLSVELAIGERDRLGRLLHAVPPGSPAAHGGPPWSIRSAGSPCAACAPGPARRTPTSTTAPPTDIA